ncbi:MAG: tetratricopeptide repeat protein [Gammaproteobacteria bacterium]|nr:tetratricopeptide repeat protein [Gammaproteobacteria bacterium]
MLLNRWLSDHPQDTKVRLALATALQATGSELEAAQTYERILDIDGSNLVALNNLALLHYRRGDSQAVAVAKRAFDLAPERAEVQDTYGWMLVQTGQIERGLSLLRKARRARPDLRDIEYHYAAALAQSGDREEAVRSLKALLAEPTAFSERANAERLVQSLAAEN